MSQDTSSPPESATKECPFCAERVNINAKKCKHCGETIDVTLRIAEEARRNSNAQGGNIVVTTSLNNAATQQAPGQAPVVPVYPPKSRAVFIVLAILFCGLGFHNFYAGYAGRGILQLLLSCTGFGLIITIPWSIIEAVVVSRDARGVQFA